MHRLELDPKYVDVIIGRWQRVTGELAKLAGSGATFEQARAQRGEQPRKPKVEIVARKQTVRRRRDELDREANKAA